MKERVILVHGLWVNGLDMSLLRHRLRAAGYETSQFSYNSIHHTPLENARALKAFAEDLSAPAIHFVCHSLGGIVIRHLFHEYPQQKPGRVVTLGTPHTSSSVAKELCRLPPGRWLLGKSIEAGLLGQVPPWGHARELGSIAGTFRFGLGMIIPGLPAPNDGTVAVAETRLDGSKAHLVLRASHFGLLLSGKVASQTAGFLKTGSFH